MKPDYSQSRQVELFGVASYLFTYELPFPSVFSNFYSDISFTDGVIGSGDLSYMRLDSISLLGPGPHRRLHDFCFVTKTLNYPIPSPPHLPASPH